MQLLASVKDMVKGMLDARGGRTPASVRQEKTPPSSGGSTLESPPSSPHSGRRVTLHSPEVSPSDTSTPTVSPVHSDHQFMGTTNPPFTPITGGRSGSTSGSDAADKRDAVVEWAGSFYRRWTNPRPPASGLVWNPSVRRRPHYAETGLSPSSAVRHGRGRFQPVCAG